MSEGSLFVSVGDTIADSHWHRPRCPSKAAGRRGTRRAWKREHQPGVWTFVMVYDGSGNLRDSYWTA